MNSELSVAALRNGTVIDHIPARLLFRVASLLDLEQAKTAITIGNNLPSHKLGTKGIIKIADYFPPQEVMDRIALIAPSAVINTIRDYDVVEKRPVELPEVLVDAAKCPNPKCITNNEPMRTRFDVEKSIDGDVTLKCHYCGRTFVV